jgi:hypothetical protein
VAKWTLGALKQYVDRRFEEKDRQVTAALIASEKRLDGMNEFRDQLRDQAATLLPRAEYDARQQQINDDLGQLRQYQDQTRGAVAENREQLTKQHYERNQRRLNAGQVIAIITVVLVALTIIVSVYLGTHERLIQAPPTQTTTTIVVK